MSIASQTNRLRSVNVIQLGEGETKHCLTEAEYNTAEMIVDDRGRVVKSTLDVTYDRHRADVEEALGRRISNEVFEKLNQAYDC